MQKRQLRGRLGEFLVEAGHIRARDLERALEIQRVAGGHLGTNLLEMGVVDEDILLASIGRLHESPTVSAHQLAEIPKEVSVKVPKDLVRRHSIVPFALHGNTVYIASQRPGDIHIENEVTLATSRLTRTFLGLEVRVQSALHRYHGHSLPLRFSRLAARLDGKEPDSEQAEARHLEQPSSPANGALTSTPEKELDQNGPAFFVEPATLGDREEWISGSRDGFDPTLSATVSRRIVWNDFEVDEESTKPDDVPQTARPIAPTENKKDQKRTQSEPETTTKEPLDPPTSAEPQSRQVTASDTNKSEGATGKLHQFPFAVRSKRSRKTRSLLSALPGADNNSANAPHVEARELEPISSPRSSTTGSLQDAHAALLEATNRDAVGRILMEGLRPFFRRRLLLAKRGDLLVGWRADGPGVRPNRLGRLRFSIADASPFLAIQSGSRFWLSSYHRDAGYQAIGSLLGSLRAPDCMILPLRAGEHIVGFLYGDNEDQTVTGQPLAEFLQLSEAAGHAFERIICRLRENRKKEVEHSKTEPAAPTGDPWQPVTSAAKNT